MTPYLSTQGSLLLASVLAVLYLGYRAALPKPLPGIPYNHDAARKLFGDVPEMMGHIRRTKRIFVRASAYPISFSEVFPTIAIVLTSPSAGSPP